MKNRKIAILAFVLISLTVTTVAISGQTNIPAKKELDVTLSFSRKTFQLGQIVPLEVSIKNVTKKPINTSINPCIKIATSINGPFNLYAPIAQGFTIDGVEIPRTIKAKETVRIQQTVLWNDKPQVAHLNSDSAKAVTDGRILSHYAFPQSGSYFVKTCIGIVEGDKWRLVESEPVEILITEPLENDLEVWNKIKMNGEFAHFLQEARMTHGYKSPEVKAKFIAELQDILNTYPNSSYAEPLRQSLAKFHAEEAIQQELIRKMRKQ